MQDKHGREIKIGDHVRHDGKVRNVIGILRVARSGFHVTTIGGFDAHKNSDVELVPHNERAGSDGDSIIWGS